MSRVLLVPKSPQRICEVPSEASRVLLVPTLPERKGLVV